MLRSFAIALGTVVALASAHPAEAAGGRQEARSAGKAARPSAAPATARDAASRALRSAEAGAARRQVLSVRGAGRAPSLRHAARRPAAHGVQGRTGLRFVSLFSAAPAAAASLPARGGKYGKATYTSGRAEGGDEGRVTGHRGVWHAGLPAADGEQMDCPSGTMAVLASGHIDTFRCMPM